MQCWQLGPHLEKKLGMRPVILDLAGDARWRSAADLRGADYVSLADSEFWVERTRARIIVIDSRQRYDAGLELVARLSFGSPPAGVRVLLTERESAREHELAYRAGTTRVALMAPGEQSHEALLAHILAAGRP
jgi:hypothetical protein